KGSQVYNSQSITPCTHPDAPCACTPILSCGHDATKHFKHSWEHFHKGSHSPWYCEVCGSDSPIKFRPGLAGRQAKCTYCGALAASDGEQGKYCDLPFFQHRPERERDSYYCGCRGWD